MDSFDTETFVKLVRDRPALWDVRSEDYADKTKKKESWMEIFREMVENFDALSGEAKERTSAKIQRKWKSLRNCFTRELTKQKSEKSGAGSSNRKKYMYFDILTFLIPALTDKRAYLFNEMDEEKDGETAADREKEKEKCAGTPASSLKRERSEAEEIAQDPSDVAAARRPSKRKAQPAECPAEDEDRLFLMSLLKDLKSIPAERKLMAKAELIQVLNRYNNFQTFFLSVHPAQTLYPPQLCESQLSAPKSQAKQARAASPTESSDSEGSILSILNDNSDGYRF